MINLFCLLFSLVTVGFIVLRAVMLDKMLPWFKPVPPIVPGRKRKPGETPYR